MVTEKLITLFKTHKMFRSMWSALFFLMDSVLVLIYGSRHKVKPGKNRILVIRLDEIGDFVLWLDSAKEYRKLYPAEYYELTLLGNNAWQEIACKLDYWDNLLFITPRKFQTNPVYRIKWLARLRAKNFTIVLQPRFSKQFLVEDAIVRASGADRRIGLNGDFANLMPWEKRLSNHWYTLIIRASLKTKMELRRNAEFIKCLGLSGFTPCVPTLPVPQTTQSSLSFPASYFVLIPGAGQSYRRWPKEFFAVLADRIYEVLGIPGLVCGSMQDTNTIAAICGLSKARLIDLGGKTSLLELSAIIKNAQFVVSNETGAVHIAAAVNTPCICIMGGGHFGRFLPYDIDVPVGRDLPVPVYRKMDCFGCNWKSCECLTKGGPAQCIKIIQPAEVWDKVRSVLDMKSK